jgi:hypothetical protein
VIQERRGDFAPAFFFVSRQGAKTPRKSKDEGGRMKSRPNKKKLFMFHLSFGFLGVFASWREPGSCSRLYVPLPHFAPQGDAVEIENLRGAGAVVPALRQSGHHHFPRDGVPALFLPLIY